MSIASWSSNVVDEGMATSPPNFPTKKGDLHRLSEVRRQQGVSLRTVARRMGVSIEQVRNQEDPQVDMSLKDLFLWQKALGVPVADLLTEQDSSLSAPVLQRSRMLKIMKTIMSIRESAKSDSMVRLTEMLVLQFTELMPELEHVSAWPSVGQRRTLEEVGRIGEITYSARQLNE